ncbi:MAG: amidohydrolase [Spirochaetales bacterium]|nr:amidohydrolase [Spirochaetales bacterium]
MSSWNSRITSLLSDMDFRADLVRWRRELHKIPEPAHGEYRTAGYIAEKLETWGIETRRGVGGTGVVGTLRLGPGPVLGLRADMDALPLQENTGLPFSSEQPGMMHACGHDGHMAILLGTANVLASRAGKDCGEGMLGTVVFLFQPAEETVDGAAGMIREGALNDPGIEGVAALHIWPGFPSGVVALRSGPVMASVDNFTITIEGQGGHGGMPHLCIDPIPVAAELVLALQHIVSREKDPLEPLVVTVGKIAGGTTYNVLPQQVELKGTVRCLKEDIRPWIRERIEAIVRGIVQAHRCSYKLEYEFGVPPTVNDLELTERFTAALLTRFGKERVVKDFSPSLGGEDFAVFQEKVPGVYLFLGTKNEEKGCIYPLHHPQYLLDEDVLPFGVQIFCTIVSEFFSLNEPAPS